MKTVALVVPCKNEAKRLQIDAFLRAVTEFTWLSVCFVNDGSTDDTAEALSHLERLSPAFRALHLPVNVGKAEAVRTGIAYLDRFSHADLFGFWDADLATPLEELPNFVAEFEGNPHLAAAIGSRWPHLGADVKRSACRGVVGKIVKSLVRRFLGVDVWDTQCGAKVFARETARNIFRDPFRTRWLFDVELLSRLGRKGMLRAVLEIPLSSWRDVSDSKFGVGESCRAFFELMRLLVFAHRPI